MFPRPTDTSTGVPAGVPAVHECVNISKDLHVTLAYNGFSHPTSRMVSFQA